MSRGEFDIIRDYFRRRAGQREDLLLGIGDDGAVVKAAGELAWVVDTINSGVHFPEDAPAHVVGHRVLAVNLSDMVAMGAEARWMLLSLSLPEIRESWLSGFSHGLLSLADSAGITLAGGDTTRGPLAVTVTLLGPLHARPVTRGGAQAGDHILVSGTLGDARAGLDIALGSGEPADAVERALLSRYLYPEPRLGLSSLLSRHASAAIDLSDGLVSDLGHILAASGVGAVVDAHRLPTSDALKAHAPEEAQALAAAGGDDYEILCTASDSAAPGLVAAAKEVGITLTQIGQIRREPGLVIADDQGRPFDVDGSYSHFGEDDA